MTDDKARAWVQALQARGVRLTVRNGRLSLHPASAYKQQSDEELLTLRHCRSEIKALVASGVYVPPPAATPAPRVEAPVLCPYCEGRTCIGPEHPAYRTLHFTDPVEIARRRAEQQVDEADARQFLETGMVSSHMRERQAARQPKPTDEEKQQAELRRKLGWDEGVLNEQTGWRYRE